MKYPVLFIGLVLGVLVLWGCSASPSDVSEADNVNEVEEVEQSDELNQVEESAQVDDVEQANEAEVGDRTDPTEEVVEVGEASQSGKVDEAKEANQTEETNEVEMSNQIEEVSENVDMDLANVISVEATGNPGSYTFSVGIASPDKGCQQYADWWEVLNEEGELIYRRVLLHSHVDEQPFVRSGGPVEIPADQIVWVRAHMNTSGYGIVAFTGSVQSGFQEAELSPDFAIEAANMPPLPNGCDF